MNKISNENQILSALVEPLRHGYINALAKQCNCSRKTVSRALFEGKSGPKSDLVIEAFNQLYRNKLPGGKNLLE